MSHYLARLIGRIAVSLLIAHTAVAKETRQPTLLDLAKAKFASRKLSLAEKKLFTAAQAGEVARAPDDNNPKWKPKYVVKAECIQWLCTSPQAAALVAPFGIQITGMGIDGDLDLDFAQIPFPIQIANCGSIGRIGMRNARLPALNLQDISIGSLNLNGAIIRGPVSLMTDFEASTVDLRGASIEGDLECFNVRLNNAQGSSLATSFQAKGARISGSVVFYGVDALGGVDFSDATIGKDFEIHEAIFRDDQNIAFDAHGCSIAGSVDLRGGCKVEGEANFNSTKIGRNLECAGAEFANPDGMALDADNIKIEGNAFLRSILNEKGEVLLGFKIDGKISLVRADIAKALVWTNVLRSEKSILDLQLAKVGTLDDDERSWPARECLLLDGFTYERFDPDAPSSITSRMEWLHRQPRSEFFPQPYLQLASVYRKMDEDGVAKQVMVRKNQDFGRLLGIRSKVIQSIAPKGWWNRILGKAVGICHALLSPEWWWYNFFGKLIGYGYEPWNAFIISLIFVTFGWGVFHICFSHEIISPTEEHAFSKDSSARKSRLNGTRIYSENYPKFNAFVYSLESFVPLVKLDQSEHWRPNAYRGTRLKIWRVHLPTTGSLLRAYLWFHIITGWVLTSLWVGGLTGLVRT